MIGPKQSPIANVTARHRELRHRPWGRTPAILSATALMFGLLAAGAAFSDGLEEMSVPEFIRSTYTDKDSLVLMRGVVSGLLAANARIDVKTHQPLFCIPDKVTMTVEQARQIVEVFLRDRPQFNAWRSPSLANVIGRAFVAAFPCH